MNDLIASLTANATPLVAAIIAGIVVYLYRSGSLSSTPATPVPPADPTAVYVEAMHVEANRRETAARKDKLREAAEVAIEAVLPPDPSAQAKK